MAAVLVHVAGRGAFELEFPQARRSASPGPGLYPLWKEKGHPTVRVFASYSLISSIPTGSAMFKGNYPENRLIFLNRDLYKRT